MKRKVCLEERVNEKSEVVVNVENDGEKISINIDHRELASITGFYNAASLCGQIYSLAGAFWWSDELSLEIMKVYLDHRGYK